MITKKKKSEDRLTAELHSGDQSRPFELEETWVIIVHHHSFIKKKKQEKEKWKLERMSKVQRWITDKDRELATN